MNTARHWLETGTSSLLPIASLALGVLLHTAVLDSPVCKACCSFSRATSWARLSSLLLSSSNIFGLTASRTERHGAMKTEAGDAPFPVCHPEEATGMTSPSLDLLLSRPALPPP